jgi:hypothetical protein
MVSGTVQVLGWLADHIGIGVLIGFLGLSWRFRGAIDSFLSHWIMVAKKVEATESVAVQIKSDVDTLANNHLKHIGEAMVSFSEAQKETTRTLISIDKNISVLVDRFPRG